jgi:hypothetical protein
MQQSALSAWAAAQCGVTPPGQAGGWAALTLQGEHLYAQLYMYAGPTAEWLLLVPQRTQLCLLG